MSDGDPASQSKLTCKQAAWQGSRALSCGWDTAFGLGRSGFMVELHLGDLFQPKWDCNSKFRAEEKENFILSIPLPVNTTKAALCVHASHCLFHVVINGVSGFALILKRLWHYSEYFPSFPGCSACPILSLCHTHHWPFSPSCTNCTKSPSSRVRESGKQLSKLPSTRKRLLP